jgi:primosomal protein N' (replication factor Y)
MASLVAPRRALEEAVESLPGLGLPAEAEVLGPLPAGDEAQRDLLRVPLESGPRLTAALAALRGIRSAHKEAVSVAVRVDPPDIGS